MTAAITWMPRITFRLLPFSSLYLVTEKMCLHLLLAARGMFAVNGFVKSVLLKWRRLVTLMFNINISISIVLRKTRSKHAPIIFMNSMAYEVLRKISKQPMLTKCLLLSLFGMHFVVFDLYVICRRCYSVATAARQAQAK